MQHRMGSSRPEDPSPTLPSVNLLISKARAPLQQHALPHLTADAVAALHTCSRATHELLTSAPIEALHPALQCLLPPGIRGCATSKPTVQALLSAQVSFIRRIRLGTPINMRSLKLKRGESAWDARWAPEQPCKSLLLECEDDDMGCRLLLLDPSSARISERQPASRWLGQHSKWSIHCFFQEGALLFTRDSGIGLAILNMDSLSMTATWSGEYQSNKFQASGQENYICVEQSIKKPGERYTLTARNVTVLERPSLQQKHVLPSPMLEAQGAQQPATCYSMDLSPDQEHLSVIWRVDTFDGNTLAQSLRIYAMSDGRELAEFDTLSLLSDLQPSQLPIAQLLWSPDGSQLLVRALPARSKLAYAGKASPVLLCKLDRSVRCFMTVPKPHEQALSWSPNGHYIHCDCWAPATRYGELPDDASSHGTVYHASNGQVAFEWSHPGATIPGVWSAAGCSLFLPSCKLLVGLPGKDSGEEAVQQPWPGPDLPVEEYTTFPSKQPVFVPAPSGRVLVGAWQAPQGSSSTNALSQAPASRQTFQLWHLDCKPGAAPCAMTSVATSITSWLTKTIAWHPGPRTAHIYAIATACGSLHLVDAKQHKRVYLWTWMDLGGRPRNTASLQMPELSWSLDGTQLLVCLEGSSFLLTFGEVAAGSEAASSGRRRRR